LAGTVAAAFSAEKYPAPQQTAHSVLNETQASQQRYSQKPKTAKRNSGSNGRRWGWILLIAALSILAALNHQTLFGYVSGIVTGQVTIDNGKLTREITKSIKDQTGVDVTVSCPSPFVGRVGDTRQCTYESPLGPGFIDVRIQSTNGDITWQLK
jgi:hypothetical protein